MKRLVLILAVLAGCGSDGDSQGGATRGPALYAIATEIYAPDFSSSVSYVTTMPSLDVAQVDLSGAREYSGRATMASYNGWLFVMDAQYVITRFTVGTDGALTEGPKLSLAAEGAQYLTVDNWGNTFISPTKSYFFNGADGSHIIWNPTTMEITGHLVTPGLVKENLDLQNSPGIVRGNRLYHIYTWADFKAHLFSTQPQQLAVYDTDTDKLVSISPEPRCPSLYGVPFMDEAKNIYFTNFIWNVTETLTRNGPRSCSVRLSAGGDVMDPSWVYGYAAVTDGREGAGLSYLGNGQALLEVFHSERTTIDASTDPESLAISTNWHLWHMDISKPGPGALVEGLDFAAGGYSRADVGDRHLVMISGKDYADTRMYEVKDGKAAPLFDIKGSSYLVIKLR